jgi:Ca2+-binding RTX toxin-like protein
MSTTITVSTSAELYDALANASGGETILLEGGDYGSLNLGGSYDVDAIYSSNVTIMSADPDDPAVFSGMDMRDAANVTIDGVVFDYTFAAGDPVWIQPFEVQNGTNVTIKNSTFNGDYAENVSAVDDGYGYGKGLVVTDTTGLVVENNVFFSFHRGMTVNGSSGVTVVGNEMYDMRSDGMNFAEVSDVLIEDNYLHDFRASRTSADHCDMIQFWTNGTDEPSENIVIRGNRLDIGDGTYTQSIFMGNDQVVLGLAGEEMFYQNVLIEDNVIVNGHCWGIAVGQTNGLVIQNNTVLHSDGAAEDGLDSSVETPRINVASDSTNVVINSNLTSSISGFTNQQDWTVVNNVFVQDQDEQAANYYGDVFISSTLQLTDGIHDFIALPGSVIDLSGAGAPETYPSKTPVPLTAQFHVTEKDQDAATFVFDATYSKFGLTGLPTETTFEWSFGDGSTASGMVVEHTFADGDCYDVILTVRLPDGSTDSVSFEMEVSGPVLVEFSPTTGFVAFENGDAMALATPSSVTADGLQLGASGTTATVAREHVADVLVSDDFAINFTLRADSSTSSGELFRLHMSFVASVDSGGEITFTSWNDDGTQVTVKTSGAGLNDLQAHDVSIVLDDGLIKISVDGDVVGSGAMDKTLQSSGTHNLVFGNPWSSPNYAGDLLEFNITSHASDFPDQPITTVLSDESSAPVITSNGGGSAVLLQMEENLFAVTTVTATDANAGTVLTYSISGGADASRFTINAQTGAVAFVAAPDFENPADEGGDNTYDLIVKVSDGTLSDTQAIQVRVLNSDMGAEIVGNASNNSISTTQTVAGQQFATNESDVISTLAGNDTLNGGGGNDSLIGGTGNDTYVIGAGDVIVESSGQGTDTVETGGSLTLGANLENLRLTGTSASNGTGNSLTNAIFGNSANNTLKGGGGTDTFTGGAGNDTYFVDGGDVIVESSGQGIDSVQSSVSYTLSSNVENLTLTGTKAINATGNTLANTLIGNSAANVLKGDLGADKLTGGAGKDTFVFNTTLGSGNIDLITDFNARDDQIKVDNTIMMALSNGKLSSSAFIANTSGMAADSSDRIIYESDTGALYYDRDGSGSAGRVQFATLDTGLNLTSADFFVI